MKGRNEVRGMKERKEGKARLVKKENSTYLKALFM